MPGNALRSASSASSAFARIEAREERGERREGGEGIEAEGSGSVHVLRNPVLAGFFV
jgi:hypothetical protein